MLLEKIDELLKEVSTNASSASVRVYSGTPAHPPIETCGLRKRMPLSRSRRALKCRASTPVAASSRAFDGPVQKWHWCEPIFGGPDQDRLILCRGPMAQLWFHIQDIH